jgi:hypothetical protein
MSALRPELGDRPKSLGGGTGAALMDDSKFFRKAVVARKRTLAGGVVAAFRLVRPDSVLD